MRPILEQIQPTIYDGDDTFFVSINAPQCAVALMKILVEFGCVNKMFKKLRGEDV